jgi:serine/arginine repetitive matrix protein 2
MEPPRKLIASSPVLQISGTDTVKRRIVMLFNDLLILAKPLTAESMKKDSRPSAFLDDPVMVKSVLHLKEVVLSSRRRDHKDPFGLRDNSTIQNFVREFKREPDYAISSLMQGRDEPETLAFILFNSHELDRAQLSTYLSRKSSRQILRSYIDQFGFTGVRIDQALRVFWSSVGSTTSQSAADNLLSGLATRWFDANSQLVSFDRDLAMRIVGAIMQLNQALHPSQYGSDNSSRTRHITAREFISAFRRYDPRYLVADDMLEHIYDAVERDKLSQPLRSSNAANLRISLKQPIPMRLIYKNETEPIVVKIPSPDSNFSIQLLGHGLLFNPPVLHFHSSSEASFRVTGTALGTKTIIMSRIGPHAPFYSGLPISRTVTVEKAFMQNVFQITSPSIAGASKTYLFSVDENHHHLPQQLQEQLSKVQDSSLQNGRIIVDEVQSASELLALKALRDTILNSNEPFSTPNGHHLHPITKAAPRQWTAKTLTRACRQNSLLPSLLMKASQSRS